jgi:drug/metabolite transporter (DMT)-like permease
MTQNKSTLAYASLGLGVIALSLSPMFVRWADAPGPVTGFYRLLFSAALLTPFFIRRQLHSGPFAPRHLILPALAGLFTAFDFAFWNTAVQFTTASNATLLGNTAPLWVALGAWLIFREHLIPRFWLGLALALGGAALIMGLDFLLHPRFGFGDLLASIAAMFYAGYLLATQRGRRNFDPFRYTWLVSVFAALGMLGINLSLRNSLTGYDGRTWLAFLGTAVVCHTVGYLCVSYALGHLPARIVSPTLVAQPILTTLIAIPLLAEIPSLPQGVGGLIALAGIFIVNQSHKQAETSVPPIS